MKKCFSTTVLFFVLASAGWAQTLFFDTYVGVWQGDLKIYGTTGKTFTVPMQLHIAPTDSSGVWEWQIHYLAEGKEPDVRKYLIKTIDAATGSYLIDEKNGIELTAKLLGTTLLSRFAVQNNLLLFKYDFTENNIRIEVVTGNETDKQKTGDVPETETPPVYNYSISNYQNAILQKIK